MMPLVLCSRCGRPWQPARCELVAGTWRICPACRDGPHRPNPTGPAPARATDDHTAPQGHTEREDAA